MSRLLEVYTVEVSAKTTWIWLRLADDQGRDGIGEATLNNRTDDVLAATAALADILTACPLGLAGKLHAVRAAIPGVTGRVLSSGLEQASLDLEGKRTGQPVHALLGGCFRTTVPCYANINRGTLTRAPEEFADRAALAIADGYPAIKLAPFDDVAPDAGDKARRATLIEAGIARITAVVERLERTGRVQVDCHSRFRPAESATILERLAGLGVAWFEEPVREDVAALPLIATLRDKAGELGLLLAGAEQASGLAEFEPFCHARCYDVIMPDIILAGGPSEVVRIGHLAAALGQAVSLHNPCGPVMDMHSAHAAAAVPELHSLERQFRESPLYDDLVTRRHTFADGAYRLGNEPGLGLTVGWQAEAITKHFSAPVEL